MITKIFSIFILFSSSASDSCEYRRCVLRICLLWESCSHTTLMFSLCCYCWFFSLLLCVRSHVSFRLNSSLVFIFLRKNSRFCSSATVLKLCTDYYIYVCMGVVKEQKKALCALFLRTYWCRCFFLLCHWCYFHNPFVSCATFTFLFWFFVCVFGVRCFLCLILLFSYCLRCCCKQSCASRVYYDIHTYSMNLANFWLRS